MAIIGAAQFLERIQFFNGERLFASDLQALESFNREMRWLHNLSLHQAGVGSGFSVTGNVGDRQVIITPGYAIDAEGEEIILTQQLTLPIPSVADNGSGGSVFYDLTVSYPQDSDLKPSEVRVGICNCPPEGVVKLREEPIFCWVRLNDNSSNRQPVDARLKAQIQSGVFLVLAQIEVFHCQLRQPVSIAQRRDARPPKSPYIASGLAKSADLNWQPWGGPNGTINALGFTVGFPYRAMVITTSGNFQANPSYVARLVGPRVDNTASPSILTDGIINIPPSGVTNTSFLIELFPVVATLGNTQQITQTMPTPKWDVAWLGIED